MYVRYGCLPDFTDGVGTPDPDTRDLVNWRL